MSRRRRCAGGASIGLGFLATGCIEEAVAALEIQLSISADKVVGYYRGQIRSVVARATTGQTVQFPASALQKHILPDGVHGRFRIEFDSNHKFIGLERVTTAH